MPSISSKTFALLALMNPCCCTKTYPMAASNGGWGELFCTRLQRALDETLQPCREPVKVDAANLLPVKGGQLVLDEVENLGPH